MKAAWNGRIVFRRPTNLQSKSELSPWYDLGIFRLPGMVNMSIFVELDDHIKITFFFTESRNFAVMSIGAKAYSAFNPLLPFFWFLKQKKKHVLINFAKRITKSNNLLRIHQSYFLLHPVDSQNKRAHAYKSFAQKKITQSMKLPPIHQSFFFFTSSFIWSRFI